ncbi:bdd9afe5-57c2-4976-8a7a-1d6754b27e91 [Sclerotinia trifoliorum]|uniref:Bdd9afe5-57c2-4976-8a7a-1d6754b27e91 n=1 Tax=Sclerotinia trifoliorum TaxID=28548 RepID=A0A8H2W600_9HELO|nr:bdd9afe5-57c2-4976-8a7a-1d6754b27e91 [Sclerotinia trifoliorum]
MSREENPTLKVLFDTGFALSQAISRRMVSSEPVSRSSRWDNALDYANGEERVSGSARVGSSLTGFCSPKIFGIAEASSPIDTPRPVKTKVSSPATQLLNDFFAEIDQIDTSESIDASYVNVLLPGYCQARERARAGSRHKSRLRVKTSSNMNSPNVPDEPPTSPSPTHSWNQSFSYSRPHVNSEEDLQELASRFQEIHTRNSESINADTKSLSNSLPNLRRRTFSNSSKVYDEEFRDVLKREKEFFESSPSFIASQMPGITGSQMQKQIPRLIVSNSVCVEEEKEGEKNAIEILEALFGELEDRENGSSEDEWKSAEEIIEGVENKGGDKGRAKAVNNTFRNNVATEGVDDIDTEMGYNRLKDKKHDHNIDKSSEINFLDQEAETEVRQYSALTQQYIANGSSSKKLDSLIEKYVEDQAQLQPRTSDEIEVVPLSEFGGKEKRKWAQNPEDIDLHKDLSSIKGPQKISDNPSAAEQDQHDDGRESSDTSSSAIYHDTADDQNITADSISKSTSITSIDNSSTSSISTTSTNYGTGEQKDPQFEMAALATGVLIASLWMIERKIRSFYV